jgi:hypothetical protein
MAHGPQATSETRWLLLIHQIPSKPNYFRVKIWRHLQRLGAIGIKDSVYALPSNDQAHEDLNWVVREIVEGGGDASLIEARLVEGLSDEQVAELFRTARDADYSALAEEARAIVARLPKRGQVPEEARGEVAQQVARLRKRMVEIDAIDFFHARGRETAGGVLSSLEERLEPPRAEPSPKQGPVEKPRGRTWVTRTGIHVDRMASAWLIERFIDPEARFKFVAAKEHKPKPGELRFDMFDGEYTHEGELCTFEVLMQRFELTDAALQPLAEIIHDVDLKDAKYARDDTPGIERVINAICMAHREDGVRLERGHALFDDLYELFKRKRPAR